MRIGDYILLKDTQRNAFLSAEGILLEDINAVEGTENLIDCLFCVHLQRQYSASRDLQAFLNNYGNDVKKIEDESAKKYLLALQVSFSSFHENAVIHASVYLRREEEKTRRN